ncbi:SH3 domain-containing protein [Herpetosiphon llansteffanensis]
MNPTTYMGMYQGKHYSQYGDTIRGFLETKDFHLAEKMLLDLIPIIEASSLQSRKADVWVYYQMLAHIYYLIQEFGNEYAVIERYLQLMVALGGIAHPEALQRRSQLQESVSPPLLGTNSVTHKLPPFGQLPATGLGYPVQQAPIAPIHYYPIPAKPTVIYQQLPAAKPAKSSISCLSLIVSVIIVFACIGGGLTILGQSPSQSSSSNYSVASYKPTTRTASRSAATVTPKPKPSATPVPLVGTMTKTGNFRNAPTTDAEIIQTLAAGTSLTLLSNLSLGDSQWYRVKTEQHEGWVSGSLITIDSTVSALVPQEPHAIWQFLIAPPQGAWCDDSDEVRVCVSDFHYSSQIGYSYAPKGYHYIAFWLWVLNKTNQDVSVNPLDVSMVMKGNRTYSYALQTFNYWSTPLEAVTVAPADNVAGGIVFLVPNDVPVERIIYRGFLLDPVTVDLREDPFRKE